MRLFHLSDLHFGIRLYEQSLIDDQRYIVEKILEKVDEYQPDGIILAGDIYDKAIPTSEATTLLNYFLMELVHRNKEIYMISGNHDSNERLDYGSDIFSISGLHIASILKEKLEKCVYEDDYGKVNIYLLPFVKPSYVRHAYKDLLEEDVLENIKDDDTAIATVMKMNEVNQTERNIVVAHQFVTGAAVGGSEINVGLAGNVSASHLDAFDYVALGHIHNPQNISKETIRYCGTPLKYSFSEAKEDKSITMIDLKEKDHLEITCIPLMPLRDVKVLKGKFDELVHPETLRNVNQKDYYQIILTDENQELPMNVLDRLKTHYPYLLNLKIENSLTHHLSDFEGALVEMNKSEIEYIEEFFESQMGKGLDENQKALCLKLLEDLK